MLKITVKIFATFYLVSLASGYYVPQLSYRFVDGYPDDLNVQPYVKVGNKLYHFGQSIVSWHQATLICRSMGGFLASFNTQEEWRLLSKYTIDTYGISRFWWTSGSDLDSQKDFFWYSTGGRIGYSNWATGQPSAPSEKERCINLRQRYNEYQMYLSDCAERYYYICEKANPTTVQFTII